MFLQIFGLTVKAFLIFTLFFINPIYSKAAKYRNQVDVESEQIILLPSQIEVISVNSLNKFHITNKSIVSLKHNPKLKSFLIKGKSSGRAELLVWSNKQLRPLKYSIYVLSKKLLSLYSEFKKLGLQIKSYPDYLEVNGKINNLKSYKRVVLLKQKYPEDINLNIKLSKELRNKSISRIYKQFFQQYIENVNCENIELKFLCHYPKDQKLSKVMLQDLQADYLISFIPTTKRSDQSVFEVKLKLVQIEKMDGEELNWGLDKIKTQWGNLINQGVSGIINNNQIFLNSNNLNVSSLAEPNAQITTTSPLLLEVGAEIPFTTKSNSLYGSTTSWKFAGLKIKLDLHESKGKWVLDYQTEFTRPEMQGSAISGNKEKGRTYIKLGQTSSLFQIGFKTQGKSTSRLPWLSKVPILGELFKSKSEQSNYKNITGLIVITKKED
jgi:hypothetical protein